MKLNKKAEGGFMESVLAVMAVVITLTAFLSFLSLSLSDEHEAETDIPANILDNVRIVDGSIEADIEGKMNETVERYGYGGMKVILSISNSIYNTSLTVGVGSFDTDVVMSKNGTMTVETNDGRTVPVNYSMAVFS
jgi:hypothetical protein